MASCFPPSDHSSHPQSLDASTATLAVSECTPLIKNHSVKALRSSADSHGDEDCSEEEIAGEEVVAFEPGQATFWQTLLNILGDLVGTGILACPIAIAHCGWILGPLFLCVISAVTLWTLKILVRIIEKDRSLRNFADVARYGLGDRTERWVSALFISECCIWLITVIVLFSDSFQVVLPILTSNQWKVVGLSIIVPLNFIPLRFLSWTSGLGIFCTWILVVILVITGLVTPTSPGSIWDPAPTDLWPTHGWIKFGLSFGLLLSGFGGHFLVPNLIRDMKHPEQANRVCEVGYGICIVVYFLFSVFGYLMFGRNVSDEVSRDLAQLKTYSPFMSQIAPWTVAIIPLTKLPLGLRPLTDIIYSKFNLQHTLFVSKAYPYAQVCQPRPTSPSSTSSSDTLEDDQRLGVLRKAESAHLRREKLKSVLRALIVIVLLGLFVVGALIIPSFETLMSIMGGGMSVITCIIIPITAGAGVWGWRWYSAFACGLSAVMCIIGVVCALLNDRNA
ncbi:hypothetical protein L204_101589 [Cryptococcus depauperatus]|nr:solute carrier family 32 (vesicular inhibitory amino acid transporter) [Cryptococcus depauperatus CBS 7855]